MAMDTAELRRFVGHFEGATTRLVGATLRVSFDGQDPSILVPVAPDRFWVVGDVNATVSFPGGTVRPGALVVERDGRAVRTLPEIYR